MDKSSRFQIREQQACEGSQQSQREKRCRKEENGDKSIGKRRAAEKPRDHLSILPLGGVRVEFPLKTASVEW